LKKQQKDNQQVPTHNDYNKGYNQALKDLKNIIGRESDITSNAYGHHRIINVSTVEYIINVLEKK
jgi:hypothetical protein